MLMLYPCVIHKESYGTIVAKQHLGENPEMQAHDVFEICCCGLLCPSWIGKLEVD